MRDKKFIIIAVLVVVVLLVGIGVAFLFFGSKSQSVPDGDQFPASGDASRDGDTVSTQETEQPANNSWGQAYWPSGADQENTVPALRAISKEPVVGAVPFVRDDTSRIGEYVRYVERTSGHIVDTSLTRMEEPEIISGETILRVGRVFWSQNGSTTLLQRLDGASETVYSYVAFHSQSTTSSSTTSTATGMDFTGRHLEYPNVVTAAVSPEGRSLFYIVGGERGSVGYLEDVARGSRTPVWTSPLMNVTAVWGAHDTVLIYTNPSSIGPGYVWALNTKNGDQSQLLGNEYALEARMNAQGTKVLYSIQEINTGLLSLRVLDVATRQVSFIESGIASLAEKCVWDSVRDTVVYCAVPRNASTKDYVTRWQLGLLASDDVLWQIHTDTGEAHQVLDPVETTTDQFDIVDPRVSPEGDFLVFRNKTNDILWAAHIPQELQPSGDATTTPAV